MADPYNARLTFLCKDETRIAEILGNNWAEECGEHAMFIAGKLHIDEFTDGEVASIGIDDLANGEFGIESKLKEARIPFSRWIEARYGDEEVYEHIRIDAGGELVQTCVVGTPAVPVYELERMVTSALESLSAGVAPADALKAIQDRCNEFGPRPMSWADQDRIIDELGLRAA
ncbi:hypothetical protein A3709_20820 [Halioglobus sp. HI00S01]|uniref:hypothetical protein n=1 Tax=Halioglobus sp. HI00S01 TaxID=1822214 RepID=UPI0007C3DF23|nr:hypothetical protein [Halioglobus sp. HI00S01]KZX58058.1 hypothetical protein A3709_20820 [Halioglobus sp. HI00S01]